MLYCIEHGKLHKLIDASGTPPAEAALKLAAFVERNHIEVLNVAGPRTSKWPAAHVYARTTVKQLLQVVRKQKPV
jgi:hypothetical protein